MTTTFRTSVGDTSGQYAEPAKVGDGSTTEKADVEVPFTEYKANNRLPLTAEYFDSKLTWDEQLMVDDITVIDDYLEELVKDGKIDNSVKSAKGKLKELEKMANLDKLESNGQRLVKLAEFVKYLKNLESRKHGTE